MRYRRYQPLLQAPVQGALLSRIASADALIGARVEPGLFLQMGSYGFDVVFACGGEVAAVSGGLFEPPMIAEPESSPFVWPEAVLGALGDAIVDEIEARLLPWLLSNMLGRRCNEELVRTFGGSAERALFDRARAYGFLGAAPYGAILSSIAPYVLGARYARGQRVAVRDEPGAAAGVALVGRTARAVRADLGSAEANAAAAQWFGLDNFGSLDDWAYDLGIGPVPGAARAMRHIAFGEGSGTPVAVARPISFDVGVSFEVVDSDEARRLHVTAPARALREPLATVRPPATGGSSGRVLFVMRGDIQTVEDADTDDALELATRLRAEGFTVDVCAGNADPSGYDIVHAFSLTSAADWQTTVERAREAGIPVVLTANADDVGAQSTWGAGMNVTLQSLDTDAVAGAERRKLFAARLLESDGLSLPRQDPYPGYVERVRAALTACSATIVRTVNEERFVRNAYGYAGPLLCAPPFMPLDVVPEWPVVAGDEDFIFCHAPIDRRANLLALVRAAQSAKLPLVIAGSVVDVAYLGSLRYMAGEHVTVMTEATPEQAEALYRAARVYADVAWQSFGPARHARAAVSGCALVLARDAYAAPLLAPGLWTADPADENAIAIALGDAWLNADEPAVAACSQRAAAWADPAAAFGTVIAAYAAAQANISGAVAENV